MIVYYFIILFNPGVVKVLCASYWFIAILLYDMWFQGHAWCCVPVIMMFIIITSADGEWAATNVGLFACLHAYLVFFTKNGINGYFLWGGCKIFASNISERQLNVFFGEFIGRNTSKNWANPQTRCAIFIWNICIIWGLSHCKIPC